MGVLHCEFIRKDEVGSSKLANIVKRKKLQWFGYASRMAEWWIGVEDKQRESVTCV